MFISSLVVKYQIEKNSRDLKLALNLLKHLLKNLTESTSYMDINIKSVDIKAIDGMAICYMVIEIRDSKQLKRLKNAIVKAVNPSSIERI